MSKELMKKHKFSNPKYRQTSLDELIINMHINV